MQTLYIASESNHHQRNLEILEQISVVCTNYVYVQIDEELIIGSFFLLNNLMMYNDDICIYIDYISCRNCQYAITEFHDTKTHSGNNNNKRPKGP